MLAFVINKFVTKSVDVSLGKSRDSCPNCICWLMINRLPENFQNGKKFGCVKITNDITVRDIV